VFSPVFFPLHASSGFVRESRSAPRGGGEVILWDVALLPPEGGGRGVFLLLINGRDLGSLIYREEVNALLAPGLLSLFLGKRDRFIRVHGR